MNRIALINGGIFSDEIHREFPEIAFYESLTPHAAIETVQNLTAKKDTDAIICVTGLAETIRDFTTLPIILSDPSTFDILEVLYAADAKVTKLEEESGTPYMIALIIHRKWDAIYAGLQKYLKHRFICLRYDNLDMIPAIVDKLLKETTALLIGGPSVGEIAQLRGAPFFFLQTGAFALSKSVKSAYTMLDYNHDIRCNNRRLEAVLGISSDAVLSISENGTIISANEQASSIFHLTSPSDMVGLTFEQLFYNDGDTERFRKKINYDNRLIELRGVTYFASARYFDTENGQREAVIMLRDTNEVESMERKVRQNRANGYVAKYRFSDIKTNSPVMNAAKQAANAFAETDAIVLLYGETGTGKELFAHGIHNNSQRRRGPFVAVNCAAIPENLLESELMGYEEGAFTSSRRGGKAGMFELAHNGTIFLDEVNQIPLHLQGSILRVIQEKQVLRIGGTKITPIDVRVIAATNENLSELVKQGKMRKDLYYRLNVMQICIPALRERPEDIRVLAEHYHKAFSRQYGNAEPFTDEAIAEMESYGWPGNVRELMNCVERYVVMNRQLGYPQLQYIRRFLYPEKPGSFWISEFAKGTEEAPKREPEPEKALPAQAREETPEPAENMVRVPFGSLENAERCIIMGALRVCGGNKQKALQLLDISRPTLLKKCKTDETAPGAPDGKEKLPFFMLELEKMEAMEVKLFRAVLEHCGGSKKKAAGVLGVSRSKLWKHLRDGKEECASCAE